jgi:5-methylcytosine-specific restriction endonuclease McrA
MEKTYILDIKKYCDSCGKDIHAGALICEHCFERIPQNKRKPKVRKNKKTFGVVNDFHIFRRDEFRCKYCGKSSIEDDIQLTLDHIRPQTMGGTHTADNLVTCCKKCNSVKKDLVDEKLIERIRASIIKKNNEFFNAL